MTKRLLAIAVFGAALFVWPSCGGDDEEAKKAEVFSYIRTELNGTWKGTTPTNEIVTVTFNLLDDSSKILLHKCSSRGLGIVQSAWACLTTYELPVTATVTSASGTYQGDLSGTATAYAVSGGVDLNMTGATTFYGHAVAADMNASLGSSSTVSIDFVKNQ